MCAFTMHVTDYLLSPTSGAKDPMKYDRFYLPLLQVDCIFCLFVLSWLFGISEESSLELWTVSSTYEGQRSSDEGNTAFQRSSLQPTFNIRRILLSR
jgi:hypothetical protein